MADLDLAFVLLAEPRAPDGDALVASIRALGFDAARLAPKRAPDDDDALTQIDLGDDKTLMVMLIPAPHPDASAMTGPLTPPAERLATAPAHYIVTALGLEGDVADKDRTLAALTAAVVRASPATAAMLGHGRLFYGADLFAGLATLAFERAEVPVEIVVDITAAPEPGDRVSFLSHGLHRYGREDFFLTAPIDGRGAIDFLRSLVRWMIADPDKHLPTGETVGRDADERVVIQREANPVDDARMVIRLDLTS